MKEKLKKWANEKALLMQQSRHKLETLSSASHFAALKTDDRRADKSKVHKNPDEFFEDNESLVSDSENEQKKEPVIKRST